MEPCIWIYSEIEKELNPSFIISWWHDADKSCNYYSYAANNFHGGHMCTNNELSDELQFLRDVLSEKYNLKLFEWQDVKLHGNADQYEASK